MYTHFYNVQLKSMVEVYICHQFVSLQVPEKLWVLLLFWLSRLRFQSSQGPHSSDFIDINLYFYLVLVLHISNFTHSFSPNFSLSHSQQDPASNHHSAITCTNKYWSHDFTVISFHKTCYYLHSMWNDVWASSWPWKAEHAVGLSYTKNNGRVLLPIFQS